MKRINNLYNQICKKENIYEAIYKSSRGKRTREDVMIVLDNCDYYADKIYEMLNNESYIPTKYKTFILYDKLNKKERNIYKPNYFPDQIIHYCLMNILEPILMKRMYLYSCGSIPGRGTSFGAKNIRKWLDNDIKGTTYCLKMDVRKFYPSINKEILIKKFKDTIKDKKTINLITSIINADTIGLPIGFYTSGWFANFFLTELDLLIKEKLHIKYYVRYVDDLVLLSSNKRHLHKSLDEIKSFLTKEDLILKKNYQIFKIENRDIDFLGFRFFRDKTILRKRNALNIKRRAIKVSKKEATFRDACSMMASYGWLKHSDSYNYYHESIKPYIQIGEMKKIIRNYRKGKK
ncbi:MAG: RNA-directed DNA polymerase [Bacilli bacterium]